jgi:hexosaminidase
MRKIIFIGLCVLVFSCSNTYQEIQNTDNDYQIIPKPEKLTIAKGRFLLSTDTKIICTKSLTQEAASLSTLLSSHLGFELAVDSSATTKGNIVLKLNATIENTEGYKLSVKYDAIVISGKTSAGIFLWHTVVATVIACRN